MNFRPSLIFACKANPFLDRDSNEARLDELTKPYQQKLDFCEGIQQ